MNDIMYILSPLSGIIKKICTINNNITIIEIYIRGPNDPVQDNHIIYAPISGTIKNIKYDDFEKSGTVYKIMDQTKKGSLEIIFSSSSSKSGTPSRRARSSGIDDIEICKLDIEVGSGYVTNEINLDSNRLIIQGKKIGEILRREL
jgi:hypothetical protein